MEEKKVPALRFRGFDNAWEQYKLSHFAQRESVFRSSSSEYPSVEYEDVVSERGCLNKDIRLKETEKTGIAFDGMQVLYGKLRPYLHNWLNPDFTGVAVGDWWVLRPVGIDKKFLYRLIQTRRFDEVANQSSGSKMPRADWNLVSNTEFIIPYSLDEQRQIAETFDSLDHLISLHQRKLEMLKKVKKSMLEKMFPKNDAKVPELRFSDFTDAWEQHKVKELCNIGTGKSNTQDQVEDGIYPFYIRSDIPVKSNKYLYDCEAVITIGDGNIGRVFHYVNGKFDLHQRCYKMGDFQDILGKYFYYFFSTRFYDRAMKMTAKATVDSVRLEMISEMDIWKPIQRDEQKKIAKFFTNLDHLISLHQRKLEKLKNIKKSMLEKMFII